MAKYSYEFKKKVVSEYLNEQGRLKYLIKKYSIPSRKTLQVWINAYKEFGYK